MMMNRFIANAKRVPVGDNYARLTVDASISMSTPTNGYKIIGPNSKHSIDMISEIEVGYKYKRDAPGLQYTIEAPPVFYSKGEVTLSNDKKALVNVKVPSGYLLTNYLYIKITYNNKLRDYDSLFQGFNTYSRIEIRFRDFRPTSMYEMFDSCSKLKEVNAYSCQFPNITTMTYLFWGCSVFEDFKVNSYIKNEDYTATSPWGNTPYKQGTVRILNDGGNPKLLSSWRKLKEASGKDQYGYYYVSMVSDLNMPPVINY